MLIFVGFLVELMHQRLVLLKTSVMEIISRHIDCFLNIKTFIRFSCTMMTLKLQTHLVQNKVFTRLVHSTLSSEICHQK